jgi:hypothetical protein
MRRAITGKLATRVIGIAVFVLLCFGRPARAQTKCRQIEGATFVDVYSGGSTSSGSVTQGGILNGTTLTVFTSTAFPSPVSTIVSYTADLTVTTNQGQLKTFNVYLYDFGTGFFTVLGRIDPKSSTGRFAGATGVLYINGKTIGTAIPFTYPSDITGAICLANQDGEGGRDHE